jgi:hypothetical protein
MTSSTTFSTTLGILVLLFSNARPAQAGIVEWVITLGETPAFDEKGERVIDVTTSSGAAIGTRTPVEAFVQLRPTSPQTDPSVEWDVMVFKEGGHLFKGMDPSCAKIKTNLDIGNKFAQTPSWFGNLDVANSYAIRASVKALTKKLDTSLVEAAKRGERVVRYDPEHATIATYKATRELLLLNLISANNMENLLGAIQWRTESQLATPIGKLLAATARPASDKGWIVRGAEDSDELEELTSNDKYAFLSLLRLGENRGALHALVRELQRANQDLELGMTAAEMAFMEQSLMAKGWDQRDAHARVLKKNRRIAWKIVDELVELARERFVVRFATGYGMTWEEQKAALGAKRVGARKLLDQFVVSGSRDADPTVFRLVMDRDRTVGNTRAKGPFPTLIGAGRFEFNRISLMDRDLELLAIIKKYVNVDGYWAPPIPSLWHHNQRFHSEVALVSSRLAVEFGGIDACIAPMSPEPYLIEDEEKDDL